jgi:hypothetical protein
MTNTAYAKNKRDGRVVLFCAQVQLDNLLLESISITFFVDLREFKGDGFDFLASTDAWLGAGEYRTSGLTALVGISGLAPLRCTDFFSLGLNTFFENSNIFSKVTTNKC